MELLFIISFKITQSQGVTGRTDENICKENENGLFDLVRCKEQVEKLLFLMLTAGLLCR